MDVMEKAKRHAMARMSGVAHGWDHVARVEVNARRIAAQFNGVDMEVLLLAVWLHDIGRATDSKDHAQQGAVLARQYLSQEGIEPRTIAKVCEAIASHRYRGDAAPDSLEGKILYDADKLDAMGMIGAARAIAHAAEHGEPIYMPLELARKQGRHPANLEYEVKLKHLEEAFLTAPGREMARQRSRSMKEFFGILSAECDG